MQRRQFFLSTAGAALAGSAKPKPVRMGIVGTGGRGRGLLRELLGIDGVEIRALSDTDAVNLAQAVALVVQAGRDEPATYREEEDYRQVAACDDIDAVLIATPWEWHARMAVEAMRQGKYAAVEVPAAQTLEECWQLVDTSESTGIPCMMLENWSFRRDNLAVLNMIREGLLGEMVHCHSAHSHDCIDHWFWDAQGRERWPARYLRTRNCDQYPTHSLGPVLSWLDINCGAAFATLSAHATAQRGINAYFARRFGAGHPNARREFAQGDIVTSVVRTQKGRTIVINYDMQLPRPYDNRWMVQGTLGIYKESRAAVYVEGRSPKYHEWEPFAPYQQRFEHAWWVAFRERKGGDSHGGTDYLELAGFVDAVRHRRQTPLDVYDSVTMSAVVALSGLSIARGGAPVECPDFTRGAWKTTPPKFALHPQASQRAF